MGRTNKAEDFGFVADNEFGFVADTPTGLPSINEPTEPQPSPGAFQPVDISSQNTPVGSDLMKQTTQPVLGGNAFEKPPQMSPAEIASSAYRPVLEYGGAAAGTAAGLAASAPLVAAGGPLGAAAASVITPLGSGVGYAGGKAIADQIDSLIGVAPKGQFSSESRGKSDIQQFAEKYAEDLKTGANIEALNAIGGAAIAPVLNLATGSGVAIAAKGPAYVAAIRAVGAKYGINLTPAEIVTSKGLSLLEGILDNLPWTSGHVQRYRLEEIKNLNNLHDRLLEEGGYTKRIEELGLEIKGMVDKFAQQHISASKEAMIGLKNRLMEKMGSNSTWDDLDVSGVQLVQQRRQEMVNDTHTAFKAVADLITDDATVPSKTVELSKSILAKQEGVAAKDPQLIKIAKFFTQTKADVPAEVVAMYEQANPIIKKQLLDEYPGLEQPTVARTYGQLADNLKAINLLKSGEITDSAGQYANTRLGHDYSEIGKALEGDMQSLAEATGNQELIKAHETANRTAIDQYNLFKDPVFKRLNTKDPGAVAKSILSSGSTTLVSKYRDLVGNDLFNQAKSKLTDDIINSGTAEDIVKGMAKLGESAHAIYNPQEIAQIKELGEALTSEQDYSDKLLKNPFFKKMANSEDGIADNYAQQFVRPGNTGIPKLVEKYIGKEGVKKIAAASLPDLLAKNQEGNFLPRTFAKNYNKYGYETLKAWHGEEFANKLREVAMVGDALGGAERLAGNPSGTGRFVVSYYEAKDLGGKFAAVGKAIMSHAIAPSGVAGLTINPLIPVLALGSEGAFILGSRQLAKLYVSDAGKKLFVDGLMTPQTAKTAAQISGRILSILGNEALKKAKE